MTKENGLRIAGPAPIRSRKGESQHDSGRALRPDRLDAVWRGKLIFGLHTHVAVETTRCDQIRSGHALPAASVRALREPPSGGQTQGEELRAKG